MERNLLGSCPHTGTVAASPDGFMQLLAKIIPGSRFSPTATTATQETAGDNSKRPLMVCVNCLHSISQPRRTCHGACAHDLVVDIDRLELYCRACKDYVFCREFDAALMELTARARLKSGRVHARPSSPGDHMAVKKRRLVATPAWSPNPSLITAVAKAATAVSGKDGLPLGLRGLNNLGNTCFMNCILQIFVHSPLLRNFYLGAGHHPSTCTHATRGQHPCLSCQLDDVFTEVYSGERRPYSPARFLYSWWRADKHLAGYQQQDAHEFYLSILQGLHGSVIALAGQDEPADAAELMQPPPAGPAAVAAAAPLSDYSNGCSAPLTSSACNGEDDDELSFDSGTSRLPAASTVAAVTGNWLSAAAAVAAAAGGKLGSAAADNHGVKLEGAPGWLPDVDGGNGTNEANGPPELASLVDYVFGGYLRSDVTCCTCGHMSTAFDPFLDISLDIVPPKPPRMPPVPAEGTPEPAPVPTDRLPTHHNHLRARDPEPSPEPSVTSLSAADGAQDDDAELVNGYNGRNGIGRRGGRTGSRLRGRKQQPRGEGQLQLDLAAVAAGASTPEPDSETSPSVAATSQSSLQDDVAPRRRGGYQATPDGSDVDRTPTPQPDCSRNEGDRSGRRAADFDSLGMHDPHPDDPHPDDLDQQQLQQGRQQQLQPDDQSQLRSPGGSSRQRSLSFGHIYKPLQQLLRSLDSRAAAAAAAAGGGHDAGGGAATAASREGSPGAAAREEVASVMGGAVSSAPDPDSNGDSGNEGSMSSPNPAASYAQHRPASAGEANAAAARAVGATAAVTGTWGAAAGVELPPAAPAAPPKPFQAPPEQFSAKGRRISVRDLNGRAISKAALAAMTDEQRAHAYAQHQLWEAAAAARAARTAQGAAKRQKTAAAPVLAAGSLQQQQQQQLQPSYGVLHSQQQQQAAGPPPRTLDQRQAVAGPGSGAPWKLLQPGSRFANGDDRPVLLAAADRQLRHQHQASYSLAAPSSQLQNAQQPLGQQLRASAAAAAPSASQEPLGISYLYHQQQQQQRQLQSSVPPAAQAAAPQPSQRKPFRSQPYDIIRQPPATVTAEAVHQPQLQPSATTATPLDAPLSSHPDVNGINNASGLPGITATAPPPDGRCGVPSSGAAGRPGGGSKVNSCDTGSVGGAARKNRAPLAGQQGYPTKVPQGPAVRLPEVSLYGCLRRFIHPEPLNSNEALCSQCQSRQRAVKQMSIRRLPPVLCFHVKRFEHLHHRQARKLNTPLSFPLHNLDMAPFLSASVLRARHNCRVPVNGTATTAAGAARNRGQPAAAADARDGAAAAVAAATAGDTAADVMDSAEQLLRSSAYELFGVVSHRGDIQGGHYISYVRCQGCWYCCDDAWITLVQEETVANCQAYMLFYCQKTYLTIGAAACRAADRAGGSAAAGAAAV